MKGAGIKPEEKPVTGQDATVAGLQRILSGEQFMTVYKEIEPEATIAAEFAIALAEGEELPQSKVTEEINNGKVEVPSAILEPVAVSKTTSSPQWWPTVSSAPRNSARARSRRHAKKLESRAEMSNGAPLLELEGVSKRFGPVQALDRVDFAVHAGRGDRPGWR